MFFFASHTLLHFRANLNESSAPEVAAVEAREPGELEDWVVVLLLGTPIPVAPIGHDKG